MTPHWLVCFFGFVGSLVCAFGEPTAANTVPGFFHEWMAAQQHVGDVRVAFRLTKTMPTLKQPVTSSGRFWNYSDGRFLWETGSPPTSVLRYNGETLASWESAEDKWRKLDPNDRRMRLWMNFLSSRNLTEERLAADFILTTPQSDGKSPRVILEPCSKRTRKDITQIELVFDPTEKRLVQISVKQGDGGTQQMDFEKPRPMTDADRVVVPPANRDPLNGNLAE